MGRWGFVAGNDTLTDKLAETFLGDGGADSINLGDGGNSVVFGEGLLNDGGLRAAVTAGGQAALGFWGVT